MLTCSLLYKGSRRFKTVYISAILEVTRSQAALKYKKQHFILSQNFISTCRYLDDHCQYSSLFSYIKIYWQSTKYRSTPWERAKSEWRWQTEKYDYMNYNYKSHFCLYGWRVSHETSVSGAAHWWIRWGELWPARCRSLRMMSPGSLPSNWLVWSSPSSSMRQDWSVAQLSVAGFRKKKKHK